MTQQVSIVEIVKSRKLFYKAIQYLLTKEKHNELEQNAAYTVIRAAVTSEEKTGEADL